MAKAWEQAGEIRDAAQRLGLGRAAVEVTESLQRRHLDRLYGDELLAVTAPAADRARLDRDATQPPLRAMLDASAAPAHNVDGAGAVEAPGRPSRPGGRYLTAGRHGRSPGSSGPGRQERAGQRSSPVWPRGHRLRTPRSDEVSPIAVADGTVQMWRTRRLPCGLPPSSPRRKISQSQRRLSPRSPTRDDVASSAMTAPRQLSAASLREAVLTADRARSARPGGGTGRCDGRGGAIGELGADGLRIGPTQAEALIHASTLAPDPIRRRLQSTLLVPSPTGRCRTLDPMLTTPDVASPIAMALIDRDPN